MTSPRAYRAMNLVEYHLIFIIIASAVVIVDRIVKFYIAEHLKMNESISVIGNLLMITRSENVGAAFGILQGQNWLFIAAAAIVLLITMYYFSEIVYNKLLVFSSALIVGGTLSNMLDRIFFGHVVDYVSLSFWPTFNLADASLSSGVVLLIIYLYQSQKEPVKERPYTHY